MTDKRSSEEQGGAESAATESAAVATAAKNGASPAGNGSATPHTHVAIIGSGFGGVAMAYSLLREGIDDFVVLERADSAGGCWRDNTYPGLVCDVPSHLYSLSFALNPNWSQTYAPQAEIWRYINDCADRFKITPHIRYGHAVTGAAWDEERDRWRVETSRGPLTADFLVAATGPLTVPSIPEIPGLDSFAGTVFHSARWNHDHDLTGERVAVIGTGASAIQFVPQIQPKAGKLTVFQRTPPWVMPHPNRSISDAERRLYHLLPPLQRLARAGVFWSREAMVPGMVYRPRLLKLVEAVARGHMRRQVCDQTLRAKLSPKYRIGCKRILISNTYYPAIAQPNVDLVTEGIAEVRPNAVVTRDGVEHPVDTIIFGTGYHVTDQAATPPVRGTGGRALVDIWHGSPQAHMGTAIAGFPNLFVLVGPNTGLGHNSILFMIESQVRYIMECMRTMRRVGAAVAEVRPRAQAAFNDELQSRMGRTVWNSGGCASWYIDQEGRNSTVWPGSCWSFHKRLSRFDAESYELRDPKPRGERPQSPQAKPAVAPTAAG